MSRVKTPDEKKALSLERDRRNSYGESPQAARVGIPRGKQRAHQEVRRVERQILDGAVRDASEETVLEVETSMLDATLLARLGGFKKSPDIPLREDIARKRQRRAANVNRKQRSRALQAQAGPSR